MDLLILEVITSSLFLAFQDIFSRARDVFSAGKKNLMNLSHRMIRDFCAILSIPDRLGLSESTNCKLRMSIRDNSLPRGMIVAASTSVWLPLTFENLFNFVRDGNRRPEWDLMLNQSPVHEIVNMPTGAHPGNGVSVLQDIFSPYRFFNECHHLHGNQRRQLSREIGFDPKRVKFWFQNKRSQTKIQSDREFFFIRYCHQLVADTWLIVDAPYDFFGETQDISTTHSWKFPSGITIEGLPKGNSKITWIDHIEVEESWNHPLYRDLLGSGHG